MEITFLQEENVYRLSATRGQKIYQKIVTEQDFTSLYVDISELHKCFSANGKIDEHTTCYYKVIESADISAIEIELEIRFQKSPKMKVAREEFSFMLPVIHRDAQLEEIVRLKKECAALTKKVRLMETYQMGYYDHRYLSVGNDWMYLPLDSNGYFDLNNKESSYIWKHKRFLKYQSMFKLNERGQYNYQRIITPPQNPGQHASQEQKEKYEIDTFVWDFHHYVKNSRGADSLIYLKPNSMKILSQKYEKMAQHHAEIEMITTFFDLTVEYRLRGKILMPPTLYGDKYYMIEHPTDPEHITHTFDLLKHLRNPPTAADRLFFNPAVGFYKTPDEYLPKE